MRNVLETPPTPGRLERRIVVKARSVGRTYLTHLHLAAAYLEHYGEPWRIRMTAPAHAARTALAKLVDLWRAAPECGGSCDQGRRPCNCRGFR